MYFFPVESKLIFVMYNVDFDGAIPFFLQTQGILKPIFYVWNIVKFSAYFEKLLA